MSEPTASGQTQHERQAAREVSAGRRGDASATTSPPPVCALHRYEHELLEGALSGELVDATTGDTALDSVFRGPPWSDERIVRAEFLADLLVNRPGIRAVVLRGARITGPLDLEARLIACPILLQRCRIEMPINVREARASAIRLRNCDLPVLAADQLAVRELELDESRIRVLSLVAAQISGELSLRYLRAEGGNWPLDLGDATINPDDLPAHHAPEERLMAVNADRLVAGAAAFDGAWTNGEVRLVGARVDRVSFNGAQMTAGAGRPALSAEGIRVDDYMVFGRGEGRRRIPFRAKGPMRLTGARIRTLRMNGAELDAVVRGAPALIADDITADVGIYFNDDFVSTGAVKLNGARTRVLSLGGARISDPGETAFEADRLTVASGMFCEGLVIHGALSMADAQIDGELNLATSRILNGQAPALRADRIHVDGSLFAKRCCIEGTVLLRGARVTGVVNLDDARLLNPGNTVLRADQLVARSGMSWRRCQMEGLVKLPGAQVNGRFRMEHAALRNPGKTVLDADELSVEQQLQCDSATFTGTVYMRGAEASMVSFSDAILGDPEADTHTVLDADGLRVRQDLFLDRIDVAGTIKLCGAHVAVLALSHAQLRAGAGNRIALHAEGLAVDRGIFGPGLDSQGTIVLEEARIGGQLKLADAMLENGIDVVLNLKGAEIGSVSLQLRRRPRGSIDLSEAKMRVLDLQPANGDATWWPRCRLTDCSYDTLLAAPGLKGRLGWLADDPSGFSPQPYERLAAVYRSEGQDVDARRVAIARHRVRRGSMRWASRGCLSKLWSWFLEITVGHGYRPWQAGLWLIPLVGLGTFLFGEVYDVNREGDPRIDRFELNPARDPAQVPPFQPVVYSVDVLVPVISLGQRVAWNASGGAQWIALVLTICGWLLTTALLAGLAARRL